MGVFKTWSAATLLLTSLTAQSAFASKQDCPKIHVFGARETTAPPGYGTASVVVNLVLEAYPGSTSEAIDYPACGGQESCGGASYAQSAVTGSQTIASVVNAYHTKCRRTQLVIVGYSQGGQITENAFLGGGDTNIGLTDTSILINPGASKKVKAVILMGSPRFTAGLPYNVGTCTLQGFAPRPAGFVAPAEQAAKTRSYCDTPDPYCCKGNDTAVHQGYGVEYGQDALAFIKSQIKA